MPLRPLSHDLLKSQARVAKLSASSQPVSEPDARLLPEPDFFDTIDQLIAWKPENQGDTGSAPASVDVIPAQTRKGTPLSRDVSKLLVCHDFKGGYNENPFERGYSFEFWHLVDTFIYFSHKRITLPPRGWVDAGHRHGCNVLGTVIFEWAESKPDLQKCLYGPSPQAPPSSVNPTNDSLPFSTLCASQLIKIAKDRNFDGYLINVETDLNFIPPASHYPDKSQKERDEDAVFMEREKNLAGLEALISSSIQHKRKERMAKNATVLSSWVEWLREEGKRVLGPHWEVIWYDSVTAAGELRWQDALTKANALFFKNSDAIFTNYTWARPPDPVPPGGLAEPPRPPFEYHPVLLKSALMAKSMGRSPADVYMGIDVFGRNCYGGYEIGRSLDFIFPSRNRKQAKGKDISDSPTDTPDSPEDLGLSVALFAPGWTWEHEKEGGGERSWSEWWIEELRFWFGKATATEFPDGSGDEVHPISRYFGPRWRHLLSLLSSSDFQPNSSLELIGSNVSHSASGSLLKDRYPNGQGTTASPAFYTNFNRGSGFSWWVYGQKVYDASSPSHDPVEKLGWTDIGSSFPKADRIWPKLVPLQLGGQATTESAKSICMLVRTPRETWVVDRAGLVDYEAWQGGTSLEVVFRPQQCPTPKAPIHRSSLTPLTVLPLCTLNACHITSPSLTISLEIIVKSFPDPAGNVSIRDLQLRPCVIWASDEVSEKCSYHIPLSSLASPTFCELANGWYSSKVTLHLNCVDVVQLATAGAVVPVVALGIHLPQPIPPGDLRILVGEIFLSAHPHSQPDPPTLSLPSVTAAAVTVSSSMGTLHWKRLPGPGAASPTSLWGILTWDDDKGGTQLDDRKNNLLSSSYFNIFAFAPRTEKTLKGDRDYDPTHRHCMWIGTSTYEHDPNSFVVAGLEPSSLIPGPSRLTEQLTSITFGVHKIGAARRETNRVAAKWEPSYCVDWMQELKVPLCPQT